MITPEVHIKLDLNTLMINGDIMLNEIIKFLLSKILAVVVNLMITYNMPNVSFIDFDIPLFHEMN